MELSQLSECGISTTYIGAVVDLFEYFQCTVDIGILIGNNIILNIAYDDILWILWIIR